MNYFILSARPTEEKVSVVHIMLRERLPPINFDILKYLVRFLAKVYIRVHVCRASLLSFPQVSAHEEVNKMSPSNISIVIGPNLIWGTNPVASLAALGDINSFTFLLINHSSEIFPEQTKASKTEEY